MYQNTDNSINEVSILNLIAQNYMLAEKTEEALESFKKNNVCGINNSLIGMLYARMLKQPDNAKEYLMNAFSDGFGNIIRTMAGHVYMYESKKDYFASRKASVALMEKLCDLLNKNVTKEKDEGGYHTFTGREPLKQV